MRFKKLELLGFKSFAEPTELTFEPGVTAIVGPNGCGKSNLADGIKWVLGEQSARELRGGRMEDLIFSGTDHRDPIHFAEVTLTLDNSEMILPLGYSEIAITRRLFRSGESEYLLNGTLVRLKDITELLMGTGIGTSAYSLFEQGRIEQIINARPEDRRAVFEEAAGITKFKSQKREALRKLEETEANLLRIGDVIAEVKRQIQALERQVRRAKAYQQEFERLKGLEVRLARGDERRLMLQAQEKELSLQGLRRQAMELEGQLTSQEGLLSRARDAVSQADAQLSQARESLFKVTHRQQILMSRLEMTRERISETQKRCAQLDEEIHLAQAHVEQLRKNQEALASVVAQADNERRLKEGEVTRALERLKECARLIETAERVITVTQEEVLQETGSQVQVKNALAKTQQEYSRLEARLNRLQMEGAKVSAERAESLAHLQGLEEEVAKARAAQESAKEERAKVRQKIGEMEALSSEAQQRAMGLEQEVTRLSSQLELLRGLLESHEGYSSGLKALLTALDEGHLSREGFSGVLAELIQVSEQDRAAVDAALGPYAQAVVVESSSVAERCRNYLEKSKAGRVLFLIRDRVPPTLPGGKETPPRAIPLIKRVGVTPHLEPLLGILLTDTWLVPDREAAKAEAPFGFSARFVTPEGEMVTGISALLGSSPPEEGLVVGRRSRLESLEVSLSHAFSQLEGAKGRLSLLQAEIGSLAQALEAIETNLQERNQELQRIQATYVSAKGTLAKLDQEAGLLKTEKAEAEEELIGIRQQKEEGERELQAKTQGLADLQATIQQKENEISQATKDREGLSVGLATWRAELASFDEILASRRASLELVEQTLQGQEEKVTATSQELTQLGESCRGWESNCQELSSSLSGSAEEERKAQAEISQFDQKRRSIFETAQAQERTWMDCSRGLEQLKAKAHSLEMEQAQIHFQREQLSSRLSQVYQVSLQEASGEEGLSDEKIQELREGIQDLSQKLQRIGPVNLGSIEEERELLGRHEHLTTQQGDLLKAKEDLHEAITKINRTTRAMFRETFQAIQKEFQVTFRQLFGGGEARLVLLDEEDLLESGIEIIARPPGKPLQAISLLSGGEKALTTIALLFAIFRVKPSPFCLLDEIDAPLDEANIGRFTEALKEFLKESQFIIITHSKKTITMADVMYGITMEESGVSKIVSVKFRKDVSSPTPESPQPVQ